MNKKFERVVVRNCLWSLLPHKSKLALKKIVDEKFRDSVRSNVFHFLL